MKLLNADDIARALEALIVNRPSDPVANHFDGGVRTCMAAIAALPAAQPDQGPVRSLVNRQADDDGLWFEARTAPEAYLQCALRELHAAVEATTPAAAPNLVDGLNEAKDARLESDNAAQDEHYDWMPEARALAGQCWCDDETRGLD